MRAPQFWRHDGLLPRLLSPLASLTTRLTARRIAQTGMNSPIPVICVGNATVGGSGKTMLVRTLLARYQARAIPAFALTRGYGGRLVGPIAVDLTRHHAADVGDEPLLLAATAPTIVARDRAAGARLAIASGAARLIMDDGLQNPTLQKTLSILVIDGGFGFGNGRVLPAGPLREPITEAAARCACAVLIGADTSHAGTALPASLPVLTAHIAPISPVPLDNLRVVAFAGIGRPEKFFESLRACGAILMASVALPDHHRYTNADCAHLAGLAAQHQAILVTTEKDQVKLTAPFRQACIVVKAELIFDAPDQLDALLP
ncbi:MAG: tetraacyldisaccharide 4'-kinase [Acidiphilium sp.]|jgi:tetraacyldisaccharide 4'-kinase